MMAASSYQYVVIITFIVLALVFGTVTVRIRNGRRIRRLLLSQWGETNDRKFSGNELAAIREQAAILAGKGGFAVDNITWNDLDMDKLYERINTTYTDAGDHVLYETLRNPLLAIEELKLRNGLMAWAKSNAAGREKFKSILYGMGRMGSIELNAVLAKDWFNKGRWIGCIALSAALILCIMLSFLGVGAALIPAILIALTNVVIAMRASALIGSHINIAQYMSSILLAAKRMATQEYPEFSAFNERINELQGCVKGVLGNGIMAYYNSYNDPANGLFYLKLFFLTELIAFYNLARSISRYRNEIIEVYKLVGLVDSMIAVASWRETLPCWCKPELNGGIQDKYILFTDMAHPLLSDPVANSLDIRRNMLLTGSNATGKSTFLKAVALNAILAQSVYTCNAAQWQSGFFRVYTSMALRDDLFSNESYFITEIKSLKRMLDSSIGDVPSLCIVDEVLRGTNTGERIAAASEALRQFSRNKCLCLAATHDIELTHILEGLYENMHFTEAIQDGKITFDYKIRLGRSQSRNAIKLLEMLGYGSELVQAAHSRLEHFEKTGQWNTAQA